MDSRCTYRKRDQTHRGSANDFALWTPWKIDRGIWRVIISIVHDFHSRNPVTSIQQNEEENKKYRIEDVI